MDAKHHNSNEHTRQENPDCRLDLSHSKQGNVIRELPFNFRSLVLIRTL